jgi:N-methylhydantoinase B
MVHLVVRCCLGPEVPNNGGLFRSVHVSVPEGSILNPRPPAPCSERGLTMYRVGDALMGAFASFVPQGVTAAGEGGSYLMRISGRDQQGQDFLCVDLVQGTWGARCERDGIDGLANLQANHTNTPIEVVESNFPIRVESHGFVPDTEGPGKYRGGLSLERSWRYLGQGPGVFRSRSDRSRFPPYGLAGGGSGAPSRLELLRPGEPPVVMHSKAVFSIEPGDLVRLTMAGGGGWGPPSERAPEAIGADLREGKVTLDHAREVYGHSGL